MTARRHFPKGFLWGTATAAHQIEGGNVNSDWWAFEHDPTSGVAEVSGDACNSFELWPRDLELATELGSGAYRFSLEWSRIEPSPGEFSRAALDHYSRVCDSVREAGIVPVVTYNHNTLPRWVAEQGGWEWSEAPERHAQFCDVATRALGDRVGMGCTINEPNIVALEGYFIGNYPPGVRDLGRYAAVTESLVHAHRLAVDAIRSGPGSFPVGLTLSMNELVALEGGDVHRSQAIEILEDVYLRATTGDDFVGVQSYTRVFFDGDGFVVPGDGVRTTQMGYEYWPSVAGTTARRAAEATGLPVYITENGVGTEDDRERIEFLQGALESVHEAISQGADIRGYFFWSLMDNFEWADGYRAKFGLFEVDRSTFERRAKPSAGFYRDVISANAI